ncbi:MAG: S8 family serine peptidase, partial [Muribaculaceae bacterium]
QQHNQVLWIDIDRTANLNIPENNSNISEPATTRATTPTISSNVNFVEAPRVWNEFKITGKGIVVALLDSGVDYNHPDLQGNMWLSAEYPHYGWDFVDNDNDPIDEQGHGTHCAGTIAGKRTGAISCGIAPDATIMIVRILDKSNGGILSNFLKGIDFAVRNNADLISASVGFGNLPYPTKNMARQAFDDLALFNIPAIIAAGNDGKNINGTNNQSLAQIDNIPGAIPSPWIAPETPISGGTSSVITVGALDNNNFITEFSSTGPAFWETTPYNDYPVANKAMPGLIKPDIVAPGLDILSLQFNTSGYKTMSGTSMSTPCVAGIVALLKQANPRLSITQIDRILQNTATKHTQLKNNIYGSGSVNAYAVVSAAQLSTPTRLWIALDNDKCTLSWEAPEKKSGLTGYQLYGDNEKIARIDASSCGYQFNKTKQYNSYHLTALYGSTESLASNSVSGNNEQLYTPLQPYVRRIDNSNSVVMQWQTPYEKISVCWCKNTNPISTSSEINYYRSRYSPDKLSDVAKLKLANAKIYTDLGIGSEATITLINGGAILKTQKVVIGKNNISRIIEIDLSDISAQFDPTLETFVEMYTPEFDAMLYDEYGFVKNANYYSNDGKTWKEVDIEDVKRNGNFAISLEFEPPIMSTVATKHNFLGYNIYQNGIKINDNPFMGTSYRIDNISKGSHTFAVTSTVNGRESNPSYETTFEMIPAPLFTPKPQITRISQQGSNVLIYINERAPVTIYQDDKFLQLAFASPTIPAILEDVAPGTHKYIIERRFNDKIGRSDEKTITVVDAYMAPKNFSATLSNDTPLLKWMPTTSAIQHHDGTEITTPFKYPETKSIKEYYIATGWSSKKMSTVANKQLKIITMKIEAGVENMHLYVYKNKQLCAEQPVDAFDYRSLVIELNNPVTVAEGDSLLVALHVKNKNFKDIYFDRSETETPENNLFSLDGVNWEPVSKYTTLDNPTNLNWYITLLFGDDSTSPDPYSPLPSHYRVMRNDKFVGLLGGNAREFSDKLPSYGKYDYTVESIYSGAHVRTSTPVTVDYKPSSVENIKSSASIIVSGREIIVSNASGAGVLSIFDTEGKQLFEKSIVEGYNSFLLDIPAGVYVAKLRINQNEESIKVLIPNKLL